MLRAPSTPSAILQRSPELHRCDSLPVFNHAQSGQAAVTRCGRRASLSTGRPQPWRRAPLGVTVGAVTSFLFADPGDLRAIAHRIAAHADHVRAQAAALAHAADTARWYSPAADTFRGAVHDIAADLRRAAGELDDAAAAMLRHAAQVGHRLDAIRHALDRVVVGVEEAGASIAHVGEAGLHAIGLG
jgi:hypothetical protein